MKLALWIVLFWTVRHFYFFSKHITLELLQMREGTRGARAFLLINQSD